ncbi:MAG: CYTH domain-containing protein [Gammaproteobacteria bacterium]|jgi:CYTH domain-containing protein
MAEEIERKFLVTSRDWRSGDPTEYRQGYLSLDKERTVRVRIAGDQAYLTIKGITRGATRREYEYPIPPDDARELLAELCRQPLIEKRRYRLEHAGLTWEIDEFFGDNDGLVVAEVELEHEDQPFERPPWLGEEVTDDPRFYNANLVDNPYCNWKS